MKTASKPSSSTWVPVARRDRPAGDGADLFDNYDPLGFEAGDPNLYRYVGNSPTSATDPSGLEVLQWKNKYPNIPLQAPHPKAGINDVIGDYTDAAGYKVELFADKESFYGKVTPQGKVSSPFGRCIAEYGVNVWLVERNKGDVITTLVWVNIAPSSNENKVKVNQVLAERLLNIRKQTAPNPTTIKQDMDELGKALQEASDKKWLKNPTKLENGDLRFDIVYYIGNVSANTGDVYRLYSKKVKEGDKEIYKAEWRQEPGLGLDGKPIKTKE